MNSHNLKVLLIDDDTNVDTGVMSMVISPDARFIAVGLLDTIACSWDVAMGMLLDRLHGHGNSVYSVAFTPDGKGLVSGSLDSSTWSSTWQLTTHAKPASGSARAGPWSLVVG